VLVADEAVRVLPPADVLEAAAGNLGVDPEGQNHPPGAAGERTPKIPALQPERPRLKGGEDLSNHFGENPIMALDENERFWTNIPPAG
jgi:hypothetical protein